MRYPLFTYSQILSICLECRLSSAIKSFFLPPLAITRPPPPSPHKHAGSPVPSASMPARDPPLFNHGYDLFEQPGQKKPLAPFRAGCRRKPVAVHPALLLQLAQRLAYQRLLLNGPAGDLGCGCCFRTRKKQGVGDEKSHERFFTAEHLSVAGDVWNKAAVANVRKIFLQPETGNSGPSLIPETPCSQEKYLIMK